MMDESLLIVGVNHCTAPVAVRERLAYADEQIVPALGRFKERAPAVAEAAPIATCNGGVNLGDVMVEGGDLYGDGGEWSGQAREPDGAGLSVSFGDRLQSDPRQSPVRIRRSRRAEPKEHSRAGSRIPSFRADCRCRRCPVLRKLASKPSLAVLPFTNLSDDQEQEYLSDASPRISSSTLAGLCAIRRCPEHDIHLQR